MLKICSKLMIIILFVSFISISNCKSEQEKTYLQLTEYKEKLKENPLEFSGYRALDNIKYLANEKFEGRKSGIYSGEIASDWIIKKMKEYRLEPGQSNKKYSFPFMYRINQETKPAEVKIIDKIFGSHKLNIERDFCIPTFVSNCNVEAQLAFVGYGISTPEKFYDDYEGIDVKGKIVVCFDGVPAGDTHTWFNERRSAAKVKTAYAKGAVGLIIAKGNPPVKKTLEFKGYRKGFATVLVSDDVFSRIFVGTGYNKNKLKNELNQLRPSSFLMNKKMSIKIYSDVFNNCIAKNTFAKISGKDPILKDEFIFVTAHHDHHGKDGAGNIYPGADDNASGTAVLLEIARTLAKKSRIEGHPKRSIYFMSFAAEEQGLYGSKTFTQTMKSDFLKQITWVFNMDMVGMGNGDIGITGIDYFPSYFKAFDKVFKGELKESIHYWKTWDASDHWPFILKGIPASSSVSVGEHRNYHTIYDTVSQIQPETMDKYGKKAIKLIWNLANDSSGDLYIKNREISMFHSGAPILSGYTTRIDTLHERANILKEKGVDVVIVPLTKNYPDNIMELEERANLPNYVKSNLIYSRNTGELKSNINTLKVVALSSFKLDQIDGSSFAQKIKILQILKRNGAQIIQLEDDSSIFTNNGNLKEEGKTILAKIRDLNYVVDISKLKLKHLKNVFNHVRLSSFTIIDELYLKKSIEKYETQQKIIDFIRNRTNSTILFNIHNIKDWLNKKEYIIDLFGSDINTNVGLVLTNPDIKLSEFIYFSIKKNFSQNISAYDSKYKNLRRFKYLMGDNFIYTFTKADNKW